MLFIGKGLYYADTADIVLNPGVEVTHITKQIMVSSSHVPSEVNNDPGHNRHNDKGYNSQLQVEVCHQDKSTDQRHYRDKDIFRTMVRDLADIIKVIGDPSDQVAGFIIIEEAERQLLDVVEHFFAHIGFDVDPQHMPPVSNYVVHDCCQRINSQQDNTCNQNQRPVLAGQQLINKFIYSYRKSKLQQSRAYRTGEVENKQPFIRPVVGEKTTQHLLFTHFCRNMYC